MKGIALSLTLVAALLLLATSPFLTPLVAEAQVPEPPNVDTLGPPVFLENFRTVDSVVILSIKNSTKYVNPVQLNFTVVADGMLGQFGNVGVSLDGGVINSVTDFVNKSVAQSDREWYYYRTTVLASMMLPTLSEEPHSVKVYYGWQDDNYIVYAYSTVDFMVVDAIPIAEHETVPFPTVPVAAASVIAIVVVAVGLLVYRKKRHAKTGELS